MKIIACLSWYDERPELLTDCVSRIASCCDHLVAIDGRYALYNPDRPALSPASQARAIAVAAIEHGLSFEVERPAAAPFAGNEVEKRNLLLELAMNASTPGDWLVMVDADMLITRADSRLHEVLETLPYDAAEFWLHWPTAQTAAEAEHQIGPVHSGGMHCRFLFRALPGLHLDGNHYTYVADGPIYLRGHPDFHPIVDAGCVSDLLHIEHRPELRPYPRQLEKLTYYQTRDDQRAEVVRRPRL